MNSRTDNQTYYEILAISNVASHHEVVQAYQKAKEAYAPDSPALYTMFSKEEAAELRKLIEEAFLILGNQIKRKEYDQILLQRSRPNRPHLPDFHPIAEQRGNMIEMRGNAKTTPASHAHRTRSDISAEPAGNANGQVPEGFARSRLSVYEVKPDFEQEIKIQTSYDGAFLRKIRQYKNINIDQMSKETRIGRGYLAAIEGDDYEALPAPVFVRGFIVQIARVLGLNEAAVANSYMERLNKGDRVES